MTYKRPNIVKFLNTHQTKHGFSNDSILKTKTEIDGYSIEALSKEYGSPLFIFSEKNLRSLYRETQEKISKYYDNFQFAWSYKTNYLRGICSVFHELGSIAEVVSAFEYEKARGMGIPGHNIIFNGPNKSMEILERAIIEDAKIHIDNFHELSDIENIARKLGKKVKIALRLNIDTGVYPQWSRFGFNLESGQALDAVIKIHRSEYLDIQGLHTHIGTFIMNANLYSVAVKKIIDFMVKIESEFGFHIDYLDLGGGFASKNNLKGVYQPAEISIPSVEDYAKCVAQTLSENLPKGRKPKLFLESGRFLVDNSGYLLTSVKNSKLLPDGRRSYVMDAGVNLLYTAQWYNFDLYLDGIKTNGLLEPAILNGPLCMNIDIIRDGLLLPYLERETRLLLGPVGAYNITQSMQFIEYRPAVVMIMESGEAKLIKRRENLESVEYDEI